MVIRPATPAYGCGSTNANGTASSTMWLMTTPLWRMVRGRWWKYQLSGFGIGWVSKNTSRHVRSRQQVSPRHLIRPAPNINLKSVQRYIQFSAAIGATVRPPAKIAKNPISTSSDSQPKA